MSIKKYLHCFFIGVFFFSTAAFSQNQQILPEKPTAKEITIDVHGYLEPILIKNLKKRLENDFYQQISFNVGYSLDLYEIETFGDKKYNIEDLFKAYDKSRIPTPLVHYILLIDGETFSPSQKRNYSLTRHDFYAGSTTIISMNVLHPPHFVTKTFFQKHLEDRLYKSIKKRLISMFGYQPDKPDCLLRFFRSVEYIDQLPEDVCPDDRKILEEHYILKPLIVSKD